MEEYEFNPVVVYEYKHTDNEEYRLEITDMGEDLSPRYEAWVFTGSGIGADTTCFQDDDYDNIKQEATELLDGFIELDLGRDVITNTLSYEGYDICTTKNKYTVVILKDDELIAEIIDNNDLVNKAIEYIDSLK